ncbi:MAG: ABC-F family ATP-binding cassette domain-containing protein [Treponema sp.]|jgi:ATP-binding cassette subfamily F protein 3|nr:ABC-F family ATP-binding cassette domain-containing protein [Treponema sp.]
MAFVQFTNISHAFGDRDILKDVNLRLALGSRSCLSGANGSGKTTLMKIMAGEIKPDSGERAIQKGTRISYLPQSGIVHSGKSLREETENAFGYIHKLISRLEETGAILEKSKNDDASTQAMIEEHHRLQEMIEDSGFYRREADISMVLSGLGFSLKEINRDTGEFSGGWQMRIALAKILLEKPDILLLDEPTNYLDIEARAWLEKWLETFTGGYLLVSHDRYFLDVCVNEVYEIFQGKVKRYAGNYTSYEKTRKIEMESLIKRYAEQQEEITKTEALIRRFRYKASKAAFAQELIKRLEKMERIEIPESLKKIKINFPPAPHSGKIALTLEGIGKSYGERRVLSNLDICLEAGERLVVAGPNGAGKTTLLRIIAGADTHYEGNVKYGTGISAGYFSQDAAEALDSDTQVIDFMDQDAPTHLIPKLRDMLGSFLFSDDDVYKSVSVLSGGEKSRLALLKMLLKPLNLLILDEPTNHLDLNSKDILLEALSEFGGTVIFVSHDRYFMEALSTKTLELIPGTDCEPAQAKLFYGNYAYYLDRISNETESSVQIEASVKQKSSAEKRIEDKQKQANLRRMERQEAEILKTLDELENVKAALETELSRPEVYSSAEKAKEIKQKLDKCVANIDSKTHEWETLAVKLNP